MYSRSRYVVTAIVFLDLPLELAVKHHAWFFVAAMVLSLLFLTTHRLIDVGWQRLWAVPLCCAGISPTLALYSWPDLDLWLILGFMAILQVPVMAWPIAPPSSEVGGRRER